LFVLLAGALEALPYQLDLTFRRLNAARGFLLKRMEHVDDFTKSNRVNRSVRVAVEVVNDLEQAATAETLQRFGIRGFLANLRIL
jgi:hypothetical protein